MVATNEFENAWLDEGINSYTEVKVMGSLYGKNTSVLNWLGAQMGDAATQRMSYIGVAETDPLSRPSYQDMSMSAYGGVTYGKTATMLVTLENVVGEETLKKALHAYFMKYRFTHPTQEDFLRTVNEVAGQDLGLVLATGGLRDPGTGLQGPPGRFHKGRLGDERCSGRKEG